MKISRATFNRQVATAAGRTRDLASDRSGNFAILTAIVLPLLLGAGGVAVDLANGLQTKAQMGAVADAASLAAAAQLVDKTVTITTATQTAKDFANSQITGMGLNPNTFNVDVIITPTLNATTLSTSYSISVALKGKITTPILGVFGVSAMDVAAASSSTSSTGQQSSLSMYFVLDKSGSMQSSVDGSVNPNVKTCNYYYMNQQQTQMLVRNNQTNCLYQRIEMLRNSVANLLDTLSSSDPDDKYVRTGATSFDDDANKEQPMAWGETGVADYVSKLTYGGGTSSTDAFTNGVTALTKLTETTTQVTRNGLVPKKYIVFMTDGENNYSSDNTATLTQCKKAKDNGITVYTIGFMLASTTAKNFLSSCAYSTQTYFDASNGAALTAAFKTIASQTSGALPMLTN